MEQNRISFEDFLMWGQEGEKEVSTMLVKRGNVIVPVYQFDCKTAPMCLTENKKLILPDLQCLNETGFSWIEVKRKNQWVIWDDLYETGCDYRQYLHYKELAEITNKPFYIIFKHEEKEPTGFFAVDIRESGRHWNGRKASGDVVHHEMFFWPINKLKQLK